MTASSNAPTAPISKCWRHGAGILLRQLRLRQSAILCTLFIGTFLALFYASDLKGLWNDDAVRLTIANGGVPKANIESRHPSGTRGTMAAVGAYAPQPLYLLLVNRVLRVTHSYSVIPVVTTNLLIFLLSAVGIYLSARRLLPFSPSLLALLLYLWNGFAMVHVLQVREYPLILCFLVFNMLLFHHLIGAPVGRRGIGFWLTALLYCMSCIGAFYTTKWAPFFLWPQAVIALVVVRRTFFRGVVILGSLSVAALACLPSVISIPRNSVVFVIWDKRTPTLDLLLSRLYLGGEYLLIGRDVHGFSSLKIYFFGMAAILVLTLAFLTYRFSRERFEIQHLTLTVLGFLAFQIAFFFLREPLSTWPRYFILYLPFVVLLIPVGLYRFLRAVLQSRSQRAWVILIILFVVAMSGLAQIKNNYRDPYVDHGPDFREVYRYLISRAGPADGIVVGLPTNRMALIYYWPSPSQVRLGYNITVRERSGAYPNIWTISYKDENGERYQRYASGLAKLGYRLVATRAVSHVTVRRFQKEHGASNVSPGK